MERYLFNKVTGESIDLTGLEKNSVLTKVAEIFGLSSLRISTQLDLDEYVKDKGTNRIVVNFGFDDWVLKDHT